MEHERCGNGGCVGLNQAHQSAAASSWLQTAVSELERPRSVSFSARSQHRLQDASAGEGGAVTGGARDVRARMQQRMHAQPAAAAAGYRVLAGQTLHSVVSGAPRELVGDVARSDY